MKSSDTDINVSRSSVYILVNVIFFCLVLFVSGVCPAQADHQHNLKYRYERAKECNFYEK